MPNFHTDGRNYYFECEDEYVDDALYKLEGFDGYLKEIASILIDKYNFDLKYVKLHTRTDPEPLPDKGGPIGPCCSFVFLKDGRFFVRLRVQNNNGNSSWWYIDRDNDGHYQPQRTKAFYWAQLLKDGIVNKDGLKELYKKLDTILNTEATNESSIIQEKVGALAMNLNTIKYGPPGTGKTFSLVQDIRNTLRISDTKLNNIQALSRNQSTAGQVEFVTFHQSFSYEEFVEGIRAEVNENGQVYYRIRSGIFKRLCKRAYFSKVKQLIYLADNNQAELFTSQALTAYENISDEQFTKEFPQVQEILDEYKLKQSDGTNEFKKFILCIDEINRANISRVLGELITLIEDTKRQGAKDAISLRLPYSGEDFFVPDNLYIVGTMNTSDHSLAKLDVALRRRFYFEAFYPKAALIENSPICRAALENLNAFLTREIDLEHTIGHSYLMDLNDEPAKILNTFRLKIKPLLQEYFLHEPGKVQEALNASGLDPNILQEL